MCLCVAVSCLSQKYAIWSLPGAFQFSVVLSDSTTSFSHTELHSMLEFCWYWFFIQHASLLCSTLFPYIYAYFFWCIFHIAVSLPKLVIKFLTVCCKQLILVILILSFPLSRQSLHFKLLNQSIQIFFLLCVIFLKQSGSLYVLHSSVISFYFHQHWQFLSNAIYAPLYTSNPQGWF